MSCKRKATDAKDCTMKKYLSLAALATVFAVGGAWMLTKPSVPQSTAFDLPGAAQAQDAAADIDTASITEMVLGAEDAPVTVIEYASFTCPHCATFHANQYPALKANYIDTGKVRFIYREVYFDRFGLWASMIARCGGEMRFFGIAEMLYAQQQDWIAGGDPTLIGENLRRIGRTAGMDNATLDACLQDEGKAQTLVAWFQENAERDSVTSTPTLFINGEKYSNMSYPELSALIDAQLGE
jgi:protein-disulfide isomerase